MDTLLGPLMRSVDRLKILTTCKKPTAPHAPYTADMAQIMSPEFLAEPERFYFRPPAASEIRMLREGTLRGRRLTEIAFPSPIRTRWPENNICHGYHLRIGDGTPHPAFVILHGWGRRSLNVEFWQIGLRLARHGIESLFWSCPFICAARRRAVGAANT